VRTVLAVTCVDTASQRAPKRNALQAYPHRPGAEGATAKCKAIVHRGAWSVDAGPCTRPACQIVSTLIWMLSPSCSGLVSVGHRLLSFASGEFDSGDFDSGCPSSLADRWRGEEITRRRCPGDRESSSLRWDLGLLTSPLWLLGPRRLADGLGTRPPSGIVLRRLDGDSAPDSRSRASLRRILDFLCNFFTPDNHWCSRACEASSRSTGL